MINANDVEDDGSGGKWRDDYEDHLVSYYVSTVYKLIQTTTGEIDSNGNGGSIYG